MNEYSLTYYRDDWHEFAKIALDRMLGSDDIFRRLSVDQITQRAAEIADCMVEQSNRRSTKQRKAKP